MSVDISEARQVDDSDAVTATIEDLEVDIQIFELDPETMYCSGGWCGTVFS